MLQDTNEKLLDISKNGKIINWRDRKRQSVELSQIYDGLDLQKVAGRVYICAEILQFHEQSDKSLKLKQAWFCKNSLCPLCAWRRAQKYRFQLSKIIKESLNRQSGKFIFLTLTQKNVGAEDLDSELKKIHQGFDRLSKRAFFRKSVIGFVRSTEITYNKKTNTYHPHLHVLMFVKNSYFSDKKSYKKQSDWITIWREVMKLDYNPSVDVRRVKATKDNLLKSVLEVAKYSVKPLEYDASKTQVVETLYFAMYRKRLVSFGGLFKEIKNELQLDDVETGDLIKTSDENTEDTFVREVIAKYNYFKRDYFIQKQVNR